jgi:predicted LPLAT superfamily acyltransferase
MAQAWLQRPERGGRRITRFYIWLSLTIGRRMARPILFGIAAYFLISAPQERRISAAFWRRLTGGKASLFKIYLHFFTFGTVVMDRLFFLARRTEHLSLTLHGEEAFTALRQSGQGFFLVSGHLGSFEALRVLGITDKELPIKVLMFVDNARQLNEMFDGINPDIAESVIPLGQPGAMLEVKEWIEKGGIVGILADRIAQGDKVTQVDFLGEPAAFPLGPWLLASTLKAPTLLFFAVHTGRGHYDAYFEAMSDDGLLPRGERVVGAERRAAEYAGRLAHFVRMAPYNWFNFFDFWAPTDPKQNPPNGPGKGPGPGPGTGSGFNDL